MKISQWLVCSGLFFATTVAFAAVPAWKIVPTDSHLTFTATQNGAPVKGEFKTFSGDINFDPNQLKDSHAVVSVDVASVNDSYNKLSETLKNADWFNTAAFPQAIFKSTEFKKTGDKTYMVKGTLSLRDKSMPVTLQFTLEDYSATHVHLKGETVIKRTAYGVGQGEWADTNTIKDDVHVNYDINAVKK